MLELDIMEYILIRMEERNNIVMEQKYVLKMFNLEEKG